MTLSSFRFIQAGTQGPGLSALIVILIRQITHFLTAKGAMRMHTVERITQMTSATVVIQGEQETKNYEKDSFIILISDHLFCQLWSGND
jgi:hypothetical protein